MERFQKHRKVMGIQYLKVRNKTKLRLKDSL